MKYEQVFSIGFYIWWLVVNGGLYIAEFYFIQSFTGIREKKYIVPYVLISDLITFGVMYCESSGIVRFFLHMGIIIIFSRLLLRMEWENTIAPAMIILTLFTFMEGFQVILMRWLVKQTIGTCTGMMIQIIISGILAFALIVTLQFVSKRYAYTGQQNISSYLYTLLLPCIFIVWVIRSGLGLDMWMNSGMSGNQPFGEQSDIWALVWVLWACAIFFIILRLVSKIITLSIQETEQKGLEEQIKKQYTYLEEAKNRNEQYRMFQHDINNHFLVLSGLLREKQYDEAEKYFNRLHTASDKLLIGIETGNPVIDVLLNEKINFARSNHIEVNLDVQIPSGCSVEDMELCIILANAIDNAIQACVKEKGGKPEISITVRKRYHFLIIEVVNTLFEENETLSDEVCSPKDTRYGMPSKYTFEYGTGLKNIRRIAEKYEGTMEIETSNNQFRLTILLCLIPLTKNR